MTDQHDRVLILDFGSQFTQLIARRIREESVYCEIHPPTRSLEWIRAWAPTAVILSGGPNSVYDDDVPRTDPALLGEGIPILGICYGMQLIAQIEGGNVEHGHREYGRAELTVDTSEGLFAGFECDGDVELTPAHRALVHLQDAAPADHDRASSPLARPPKLPAPPALQHSEQLQQRHG